MLFNIFIAVLVALAALAAYIARQPDEFRVSRSASIKAPADKLFASVNNLRAWLAWSPWVRLDPTAINSFEGPEAGVGAISRWKGSPKVGEGSMTITDSKPDSYVKIRLDFLKPMQATNSAEFTFQLQGDVTLVTWSMNGKSNFIGKAMNVFMNCEAMCGKQFEQGLANLAEVVAAK